MYIFEPRQSKMWVEIPFGSSLRIASIIIFFFNLGGLKFGAFSDI